MRKPNSRLKPTHRLPSGVVIRAGGLIADVAEADGVVGVLVQWLGDGPVTGRRRVHGNNLYGFDARGCLRWRVHLAEGVHRPLLLTGFIEDGAPFTLHEAHGWWVRVDPATGRVVKTDFVG